MDLVKDEKLSVESARKEIERFTRDHGIELDPNSAPDVRTTEVFIRNLRNGRLTFGTIEDEFICTYRLVHPVGDVTELKVRQLDGQAKMRMGEIEKDSDHHGKIYYMMAYLTGLGIDTFKFRLKAVDLIFVERIGLCFLNG